MSAKFGMSSTIPISAIKIPVTARTVIPTILTRRFPVFCDRQSAPTSQFCSIHTTTGYT